MLEPLNPQKIILQDLAGGGRPLEVAECRVCSSLAWSPDGTALLASDGNRQLMHIPRLGGSVKRFPGGEFAVWSPDGSEIATCSFGSREVVVLNASGSEVRRIPLNWELAAVRALDWSISQRLGVVSSAPDGRHSVWLVSPDGKTQEKIVEETGTIGSIRWSPDDRALLYMRGTGETFELWRLPLAGDAGPASGPAEPVMAGIQAGPNFSVARDGRRLLYTRESHYSNLWIASIDAAGSRSPIRQITSGTSRDQFPAVSPDGTRIAFVRGEGTSSNVHIMPVEGGAPQPLTSQMSVVGAPAWSPDGTALAVCARSAKANSIWRVEIASGQIQELAGTACTTTVSEVPVMWWPRREILYQRTGNRNYSIYDPETRSERPLIRDDSVGWLFGPRSSPDGTTLAAYWNRGQGNRGIWLLPWNGDPPSLLLSAFAWPLGWSADGTTIVAYVHAPTTAIVTIRRSGGPPSALRALKGQRISLVPAITPDTRTVVYSAYAMQSDIWLLQDFNRR
jgi:Tol biopolymer transport system component